MGAMMKLNLGSNKKKLEGYVNIDIDPAHKPDLVCDVTQGLPFDDSTIDEVRAFDFLEHIPLGQTMAVINDIWRVLKPGGLFEHLTPSTDGRGAFQDPTHLSFWNINSWLYFTHDAYREIYNILAKFSVELLRDIITGEQIIHTHGRMYAVK
jgi:predicted SAM-dependent methyltransferase